MPRERSAVPIDADVEIVLIPDGDLRALEDAFGAAFEAEQDAGVVIEASIRDEGCEVSAQRIDLKSGDIAREMLAVGAEVCDRARRSCAGGVVPPGGAPLRGVERPQRRAL